MDTLTAGRGNVKNTLYFSSCTLGGGSSLGKLTACASSSGCRSLTTVVSDFGYQWYAKAFGDHPQPPRKIVRLPECAHYLDDVSVPGPSVHRPAPAAGCLRDAPASRDARNKSAVLVPREGPVEVSIRLVPKINGIAWSEYHEKPNRLYLVSGIHWPRLEQPQEVQEAVCLMAQRRQYNTPDDALKAAGELAMQVRRDRGSHEALPTACVADV